VRKIRIFQPESYISLDYQEKKMAIFTLGPGQDDDPMSRIKIEQAKIDEEDALRMELRAFVESVRTRDKPAVSGEDGRRALEAAMLVHEEIRKSLRKFFRG
jgi:predicted dehydrogenase